MTNVGMISTNYSYRDVCQVKGIRWIPVQGQQTHDSKVLKPFLTFHKSAIALWYKIKE